MEGGTDYKRDSRMTLGCQKEKCLLGHTLLPVTLAILKTKIEFSVCGSGLLSLRDPSAEVFYVHRIK